MNTDAIKSIRRSGTSGSSTAVSSPSSATITVTKNASAANAATAATNRQVNNCLTAANVVADRARAVAPERLVRPTPPGLFRGA